MIIASVIIPCKDRQTLMERAVKSIVELDNNKVVEIIVVDDGSDEPLYRPDVMREWDRIITLSENRGGAVSRNIGIDKANGEIIYLLDSDDYFIYRDFENDYILFEDNCIYYGDIDLNGDKLVYPKIVNQNNYLKFIFKEYPYLAQTSTLAFKKNLDIRFDINLPKHQDWDLVYYALKKNIELKKYKSITYIDKNDNNSISRTPGYDKSEYWNEKIYNDPTISIEDKLEIMINTNGMTSRFSFNIFYPIALGLIIKRELKIYKFFVLVAKRLKFFKKWIFN